MEQKDLTLLVLIPLLVTALIIYTEESPSIFGAVVGAEVKDDNFLGTYKVLPNFRANIDYDISEYDALHSTVENFIEKCKLDDNIENCIKKERENLEWECPKLKNYGEVLDDLLDKLNECLDLEENDVVCKFSLDENNFIDDKTLFIKILDQEVRQEFVLFEKITSAASAVTGKGADTVIHKRENILNLDMYFTNYDNRKSDEGEVSDIEIKIDFKDSKPTIDEDFSYTIVDGKTRNLHSEFVLYKQKNRIKFIDPAEEALFRNPIGNRIETLPKKRGLEFCVPSKQTVFAYDEDDGESKLREINYKFAVTFPRPIPSPIKNLKVFDTIKGETTAIVTWDSPVEDYVSDFVIYISKKSFFDTTTADLKKDSEISTIIIPNEDIIEIEDVDFGSCFLELGKRCNYNGEILRVGKLYFIEDQNKFMYLVDQIEDTSSTNYAVTARDDDEKEIDNDRSITGNKNIFTNGGNYVSFFTSDNLAPGLVDNFGVTGKTLSWGIPLTNIDGSLNLDTERFEINYKLPGFVSQKIEVSKDVCSGVTCNYELDILLGTYEMHIIALDEAGNDLRREDSLLDDLVIKTVTVS